MFLFFLLLFLPLPSLSQLPAPQPLHDSTPLASEFFNACSLDILNTGQLNAAARLARITIGEEGKFSLPIQVYSGTSGNHFQGTQTRTFAASESMLNNLLNPISGLLSISIDGLSPLLKSSSTATHSGIIYQAAARVLTSYRYLATPDPFTQTPVNFTSMLASAGLYFKTVAKEKSLPEKPGSCWLLLRFVLTTAEKQALQQILPGTGHQHFFYGCVVSTALEIRQRMNIRISGTKFLGSPTVVPSDPLYEVSFQYSMK